jgi:hypothetical protein
MILCRYRRYLNMKTEWTITKDLICKTTETKSEVGRKSEGYTEEGFKEAKKWGKTWDFRLYDDDKILYYEGKGYGDVEFDPLDWAMYNDGCTYMTYNEGWRVL